jgi:glycosyltransferase involved in cell wall biosynthesis
VKILYLSMSYNENRNDIYNNLVDELISRGHKMTIVRSDYQIKKSQTRKINDYLLILDVKTGNPFSRNLLKKGMNQILLNYFFINSIKKKLKSETYDLVLYATPPITLYKSIRYCKEFYNAKTFLMLKDIFPQNAVDLEMISGKSLIYKYFRNEEAKYYKISDYIGCMSEGNMNYIIRNNSYLDESKIHIFPNSIRISNSSKTIFNDDYTIFVFGGNLGKPQNFPFLLEVFKELREYDKARFLIVGTGTEEETIKKYIEKYKLENVTFKTFLPPDEYEKIVLESDVGIISLDSRFTIPNIPSKFQSYLKQRKPVLAITDVHTDLREMIEDHDCGWWCSALEKDEVIKKIKYICENKEKQVSKGLNGYRYLLDEFDVKDNVRKMERFMEE